MAKGTFKCSKCDRTFSMAAHLARHDSTIHAAKSTKKLGKKKTRKRKAKRKVGRPKGKKKVRRSKVARRATRRPIARGTAGLIRQMQIYHRQLSTEHAGLEAQITAMNRAIEALGGTAKTKLSGKGQRGSTRRGGRRVGSLKDYILRALRGKVRPMRVADIAARVKKAGYKTKAKRLPQAVSNTLAQMAGVKKVGRGLYRA